jgi:TP901 family phage tail tape measure protein
MGGASSSELALIIRAKNQASAALATVGNDLDRLDNKASKLSTGFNKLATIGIAAFAALAIAVGATAIAGIRSYANFDAKMTESLAIMGDVSEETRERMEATAREVAKTTTFSANEAAQSYFYLASAGLDAQQQIAAMPQVAKFAQAGMFDMALATDLATDAQSALGLTVKDASQNLANMTRVTDVLVKANTLANATVQQFSEALTNGAGAALKIVNKDVEEGVAVLAAFADQGVKGAQAGTAFGIVMRDLQTKALQNSDAFEKFNIEVFDTEGKMKNIGGIIADVENALDGMSDAQAKATLAQLGFSDKSVKYLQTLLGTSDAIAQYEEGLRNAAGATEEVANNQLKSISAQWDLFKSRIADVVLELGKQLSPVVKDVLTALADWAERVTPAIIDAVQRFAAWIREASETIQNFWRYITDVIETGDTLNDWLSHLPESLQGVAQALGNVVNWWKELDPGIKDAIVSGTKFIPVVLGIAAALKVLAVIFAVLTSPIILVVAAVIAIGAALKYAWENSETFRNIVQGVVSWFTDSAVPWLSGAWDAIVAAVSSAWDKLTEIVQTGISVFQTFWSIFGETIVEFFSGIWDSIVQIFEGVWQVIQGIWQTVSSIFKGDWEGFWQGIENIVVGFVEIVTGLFSAFWTTIQAGWSAFFDFIRDIWPTIWEWVKSTAQEKWDQFVDWIGGAWESLKAFWEGGWSGLVEYLATAFAGIGEKVKAPLNTVLAIIESVINAAISGLNGLIGVVNKVPGVNIGEIGSVTLPRLASGGRAIREGLALVGEEGPEIIRMARGAEVVPLDRMPGGSNRTIVVPVYLDANKKLTELVIEESGLGDITVTRRAG